MYVCLCVYVLLDMLVNILHVQDSIVPGLRVIRL